MGHEIECYLVEIGGENVENRIEQDKNSLTERKIENGVKKTYNLV